MVSGLGQLLVMPTRIGLFPAFHTTPAHKSLKVARWLPWLQQESRGSPGSSLLASHWPEVGHVATPGSKGWWERKFPRLQQGPGAGCGMGQRDGCPTMRSREIALLTSQSYRRQAGAKGREMLYSISTLIDLLWHSGPATKDMKIKATPLPFRNRRRIIIAIVTI